MGQSLTHAGLEKFGTSYANSRTMAEISDQELLWANNALETESPHDFLYLACGNATTEASIISHLNLQTSQECTHTLVDIQPDSLLTAMSFSIPREIQHSNVLFGLKNLNCINWPFRDKSMSGIWFTWGMHWLTDPTVALPNIHRILKPGGVAYITVLTPWDIAVSNETFSIKNHTIDELQERFPNDYVNKGYDRIKDEEILIVDHENTIIEYFATHPSASFYQYCKSSDSRVPKQITGFTPKYFLKVAKSLGFQNIQLELQENENFRNNYHSTDPRSKSKMYIMLQK